MKHKIHNLIIASLALGGLSGCGRVVDWAKDTFYQGKELEEYTAVPRAHTRSVIVYNQFTTAGRFDALWLSDKVRTDYADLYAFKLGKSVEQKKAFLRRQLEENNHFISFYVLSSYGLPLGNKDDQWALFLKIDDNAFAPIEIKAVDLSPEYQLFFGKKFNRFKIAYLVKFNAQDLNDRYLIEQNTKKIELYFRSVEKEVILTWSFDMLHANANTVQS